MHDDDKRVCVALIEAAAMLAAVVLSHPDTRRFWYARILVKTAEVARGVAYRAGRVAIRAEKSYDDLKA